MENALELMRRCCAESPLPVLCKMRVLADVNATVALAKRLEDAGVYCLTVHGRKRGQQHHAPMEVHAWTK